MIVANWYGVITNTFKVPLGGVPECPNSDLGEPVVFFFARADMHHLGTKRWGFFFHFALSSLDEESTPLDEVACLVLAHRWSDTSIIPVS